MRESYRDRAVVLRTYDFSEADRVIVLLTREHGVVRAVAKGVRRTRSRFGSRLQLFVDLNVALYPGHGLSTITGADTVNFLGAGIIDDYERYGVACAAVESAERLAVAETGEDPWLFDALVDVMAEIRHAQDPMACLDGFLLNAMEHAGWAPSLFDCAVCSKPGPHHAFHPGSGGAVCTLCRPPGAAEVDTEVLHVMWLLARGENQLVDEYAQHADARHLFDTAHRLTRAHLQWHLEQKITALSVLDRG